MAGVRKRGKTYYGYFYGIKDGKKKRIDFKGTGSKTETLNIARMKEDEHRRIMLGYKEAPTIAERHKETAYREVVSEFIAWGKAQGGRNGYPWSIRHARRMHSMLERFWPIELGFVLMGDVYGILPKVEKVIQSQLDQGKSGKSILHDISALNKFCEWCIQRDYLTDNPLKKLSQISTKPKTTRRAITKEELAKIFGVVLANTEVFGHWEILLLTSCCTGLRRGALQGLTIQDLDRKNSALKLQAATSKNRKDGMKEIPPELCRKLIDNYQSGEPLRLYRKYFRNLDTLPYPVDKLLLYVPSQPARELAKIMELAGVEQHTDEGKIDFHAIRVAYATFIVEAGATLKEVQAALDHSDPRISANVYTKARPQRMQELACKVFAPINAMISGANMVPNGKIGSSTKNASPLISGTCALFNMERAGGIEPP